MTNLKATKKALVSSVLALVMCFTMLLGTTFAWFTDSVTSANNVIQTGTLNVGFQWAEGTEDPDAANWNNVEGALFDYANWEPGYSVAKHLKISNNGSLGLNYKVRIFANGVVSDLAEVIDVYVVAGNEVAAMNRNTLKGLEPVGTLTQVLLASGADNAENEADWGVDVSEIIRGSLEAGAEAHVYTIVLKMNENAGNEYQDMDLGCTFSVQLLATQMASEEDSFDNQYDAVVPNEEVPAALVRPFDNLNVNYTVNGWGNSAEVINKNLDTAYSFQPTEDEIDLSFYKYWMAEYVVSADKDVPANSMALAGYYSFMCELANNGNWVALTADETISAGTEIMLMETMGYPVHYKDIVQYGAEGIGFRCGAVDLTGENMGTTLTVELRIYETEAAWDDSSASSVKTGKYITIGKFEYTFGVNTAEKLEYALEHDGEYKLTADLELDGNETLNVPAGVETTLDLNGHTISASANKSGNQELFLVKGDLTVKNGSLDFLAENNQAWDAMATIFDVTAGGTLNLENVEANIAGTDMNFIVHLNNWGSATLNVNDCDFTTTYVAIRAFNSGYDMNTVTVKNTDFHGGRMFWVHNYTSEGKDDTTLDLDIYGNGNTSDHAVPVRFGFSNSVYFDINGVQI